MTDEEAPAAAAVDTAIPQATNGGSTTSSAVRDRKLSVVSKQFDVNGDGQLDEAEQAMRNLDQTGRGYLTNDKVYALMVEQMNLQKSVFQMKKVIIGLVVLVVILALSNLGTSFASAILAKDSTTNDQNELISKETGEALATQSTHKVIVLNKDDELSRRRKLACEKQQGEATGDCNFDTLGGTISKNDGQIISRLCYLGQAVDIYFGDNGGQHKNICPASTDPPNTFTQPETPSFVHKGDDYPSDMQITTASEVIDLKSYQDAAGEVTHYELTFISCDTSLGYSVELVDGVGACTCPSGTEDQGEGIGCVPVGGQAAITCEDGDEPVCGADGTPYDCEAMADGAALASPPTACQCGGVSGRDPNDGCYEKSCFDPVCVPCSTGHFPTDSCCTQCTDLNGGYVDFPGVTPTSDADCDTGYLFDSSTDTCIQCDAGSGYAVVSGSCVCPEGTTEENGACVANSTAGGCQFEDSTAVCVGTTYYSSAADVPVGETCSEAPVCAAFVCEGGGSPQPCNSCQCPTPK